MSTTFNAKGYCFRTWKRGNQFPDQPMRAEVVHDEDDFFDFFRAFRHEVNKRINEGHQVVYWAHKWRFVLRDPAGFEYDIYMYETSSIKDAEELERESRETDWIHPNLRNK